MGASALSGGRRRGWLWGAAALLAVLAAVGAWVLRPAAPGPPSTFRSNPGGMRGLYLLLRGQGVPVARWTRAGWPATGLLVGAVGPVPPSLRQARSLRRWVATGHRAVLAGTAPSLLRAFGLTFLPDPYPFPWARAAIGLPSLRGADQVLLPEPAVLLPEPGGPTAVPLYTVFPGLPAVVQLPVGSGSLVWLGSAQVWTNQTLVANPGNLRLALNLLDTGDHVWFDEAVFGRGAVAAGAPRGLPTPAGVRRPTLPWPLNALPALLAAVAAGAAGLWAAGWRRLPVRPDPPRAPAPDEAVRAYGLLLFRAGATRAAPRQPEG